ncbi:MAG: ABC transporter ATP-binding protein [Clostridium sp.]|nr:ABC transporter ATP-binding protein [Clostridium sp.]MDU7083871.1 ABC transporter ATP-binding protein [Clostridium sp.]
MKIQLKNICKNYKNVEAVKDLTVDIEDGTLVCLLGPSGCGKSTTLSMIAGLDTPTGGEILFNGENFTGIAAEDRDIGMVFQNYALYPHMTIMENIAFPLKMRNVKKKERIEKVKRVAKIMQIEELLNRKPSKLSGGQQQRVAIARAIVKEPKILLLDEPLSNLDARLRIELREEIRSLQRKLNITTIFVTHDQEEALSISDKILLLNNGVLQQYSTPKDMYMCPKNKFVAGFLGNPPMNFMCGTYDSGKVFIENGNITLPLPVEVLKFIEEFEDKLGHEEKCTLGIRPEDLVLCGQGEGAEGNIISVQTLGKEVYLNVDIKGLILTACTSWENNYNSGDRVYLKAKRVYLFNR